MPKITQLGNGAAFRVSSEACRSSHSLCRSFYSQCCTRYPPSEMTPPLSIAEVLNLFGESGGEMGDISDLFVYLTEVTYPRKIQKFLV